MRGGVVAFLVVLHGLSWVKEGFIALWPPAAKKAAWNGSKAALAVWHHRGAQVASQQSLILRSGKAILRVLQFGAESLPAAQSEKSNSVEQSPD